MLATDYVPGWASGEVVMPKRLVDIDDELLEVAGGDLNTLMLAATRSAWIGELHWFKAGGMAEKADRDTRDCAWLSVRGFRSTPVPPPVWRISLWDNGWRRPSKPVRRARVTCSTPERSIAR